MELIGGERVYQFGIRSGTREEFAFGRANTRFFPGGVDSLEAVLGELAGRPPVPQHRHRCGGPGLCAGDRNPEAGGIGSLELFAAPLCFERFPGLWGWTSWRFVPR